MQAWQASNSEENCSSNVLQWLTFSRPCSDVIVYPKESFTGMLRNFCNFSNVCKASVSEKISSNIGRKNNQLQQ